MKMLMVLTSHAKLGNTHKKTGFWLEEFASPYYVFSDAGVGGQPPIDPKSDERDAQTDATRRFNADPFTQGALAQAVTLSSVSADDFDTVFYPDGHDPFRDLSEDKSSIALILVRLSAEKPVAAVCHAPGVLPHVKFANGDSIVKGKKVTGFSNNEEAAAGLTDVVPFQLKDMLKENGGLYSKLGDWEHYIIVDGLLITGQNPAPSEIAAKALLTKLA
ncbi:MAG: type 1 glutamine amidotransferase domain-containing protein [Arenimonas sp.]